jgi:hypothetical protein
MLVPVVGCVAGDTFEGDAEGGGAGGATPRRTQTPGSLPPSRAGAVARTPVGSMGKSPLPLVHQNSGGSAKTGQRQRSPRCCRLAAPHPMLSRLFGANALEAAAGCVRASCSLRVWWRVLTWRASSCRASPRQPPLGPLSAEDQPEPPPPPATHPSTPAAAWCQGAAASPGCPLPSAPAGAVLLGGREWRWGRGCLQRPSVRCAPGSPACQGVTSNTQHALGVLLGKRQYPPQHPHTFNGARPLRSWPWTRPSPPTPTPAMDHVCTRGRTNRDHARSPSPEGGEVSSGGSTLVDVDDDIAATTHWADVVAVGADVTTGVNMLLFQDRVSGVVPWWGLGGWGWRGGLVVADNTHPSPLRVLCVGWGPGTAHTLCLLPSHPPHQPHPLPCFPLP